MTELEREISVAINKCSAENGSDTPDFILAAYLLDCLTAFNRAIRWRDKWYSPEGVPVDERDTGPKPPYERLADTDPVFVPQPDTKESHT